LHEKRFLQNNNPELLEFEESVGNEEVDEEGKVKEVGV